MLCKNIDLKLIIFSTSILLHSNLVIGNEKDICFKVNKLLDNEHTLSKSTSDEYIIESDYSAVEKKNIFNLSGNVIIKSNDKFLSANTIKIDSAKDHFTGVGNIKFKNDEIEITGENISHGKDYTKVLNSKFLIPKSNLSGSVKELEMTDNLKTLLDSDITNCPINSKDWEIHADKIIIDEENNLGTAINATINVFGVPIFYHPKFSWILSGRGSGFLAPTFSKYTDPDSKKTGYKISIPYYLNIAKDKDLLFNITSLSTRGYKLDTTYRQLVENNSIIGDAKFNLQNNVIPEDKITKKARWFSKNEIELNPNKKTQININSHRVSDTNYFKEVLFDNGANSLISDVLINHSFDNGDNFSLLLEDEQIINNGSTSYIKKPEIKFTKAFNTQGYDLNTEYQFTNFTNKDNSLIDGNRSNFSIGFSNQIIGKEFNIYPKFNLNHTSYNISDNTDQDRTSWSTSVLLDQNYSRKFELNNVNYYQTLTPKIAYNFKNRIDQSSITNFDSEKINNSNEIVFDKLKFSGLDRVSNRNDLSLGLQTSFEKVDGTQLLNSSISQSYKFNDYDIGINGNFETVRNYSNIIFDADLNFFDLSLNSEFSYNPETSRVDSSSLFLSKYFNNKKSFNVGYSEKDEKTFNIAATFPMLNNIELFGMLSKNLTSDNINKSIVGLSYESCCWEAKIVKFDSDNNLSSDSLEFEISFKDFVSTSPALNEKIKSNIPIYFNNPYEI